MPKQTAVDIRLKSNSVSPQSSESSSTDNYTSIEDLRDPCGIRDMELAKHYFTHTVETFVATSACKGDSELYRVFIPAVALSCAVIRQGMLTLAAIHLHFDSVTTHLTETPSRYLRAAEAHGKVFVKESRQKLQEFLSAGVGRDSDSLLACSKLLCVLGFAFFRAHRQNGIGLADTAAWTWLQLLRGMKTSYITVVEAGGYVSEMVKRDLEPELRPLECLESQLSHWTKSGSKNAYFRVIQGSAQQRFDALQAAVLNAQGYLENGRFNTLSAAVTLLYEVTGLVCSYVEVDTFRAVCIWPRDLQKGCIDMIMDGEPLALAVYAHWLILVATVEDLWWVGDMGRSGLHDILKMCSDAGGEIRELLYWPQRILNLKNDSTT